MSLPAMTYPPDAKRMTLRFYDGCCRDIGVTQACFPYPEGQLIISRTDLAGNITHANNAFVILSGYSKEELLGQPHYIIRHPDMPRAAFKDLWDTVCQRKKWHGYVKNLRKDGGHYWVYATVVANYRRGEIEGFTSVRRQASAEKITEMSNLYRDMLAAEHAAAQK